MISEANLSSKERLKRFTDKGLEYGVECRVCQKNAKLLSLAFDIV